MGVDRTRRKFTGDKKVSKIGRVTKNIGIMIVVMLLWRFSALTFTGHNHFVSD